MMRKALLALLLLAAVVRVPGFLAGLPHVYVPDTHMIRGALGMAKDKDLAPPANKYTSYPYLMPYLLLPGFAGLYVGGKATGAWTDAADFGGQIVDDPTPVYAIAHALVLAFGLLGVGLAWRVARLALGPGAALPAAFLVATSFLLVHLGKSARPWVPLTALVLLALERALSYARAPGAARALALGAAAGLALACHQAGALAVLLPAAAVLARARGRIAAAARDAALAALAFGAVAIGVGFPYVLRGHAADVGVEAAEAHDAVNLGGQGLALDAFGTALTAETAVGFAAAEPALLLLAALGAAAALRRLREQRLAAVVLLYPVVVLVLFHFYEGTHVRYLTPAVPFLCLLGGMGVHALWRHRLLRPLACALLLWPLAQVLRLDVVMNRTDTRTEFLGEIAALVPAGATVAVEGYGPPLRFAPAAVLRLEAAGAWASQSERREAAGATPASAQRPGFDVVPLERFYRFASVWPDQYGLEGAPPKPIERFLDEVGARYLVTADRAPGAPRNSALDAVLARRGRKLAGLDPFAGAPPGEAYLPMDPREPLLALWRVHRPGPSLALWEIAPE